MKQISLKYGTEKLEFAYESGAFDLLLPDPPRRALDAGGLRAALATPVESPPLRELARGKRSALIVVSDATRVARADLMIPPLLEELQAGGIGRGEVRFVVALGNHRPVTPAESEMLFGPAAAEFEILQHDSRDQGRLELVGRTERGIEVRLSRLLREHDLVITISSVGFHYFAGFGGGRKSVIPGMAGYETIVRNHLLAVDFERGCMAEGVEPGRLAGNPVNEDMEDGVAMRPPAFAIHTILTPEKEIGAVWAGDWRAAHRGACGVFLKRYGVPLAERRPLVIASAGGYPKDIDFIQSHKAIQYASAALEPGGTLVLLARCPEGIGNPDFLKFFPLNDMGGFLESLKSGEVRNGQSAMALYTKTKRYRIILVSELSGEQVRAMNMELADDLDQALASMGKEGPGYIIPEGGSTLPLLKAGSI
jgi:nickel-dependent lactate racemase